MGRVARVRLVALVTHAGEEENPRGAVWRRPALGLRPQPKGNHLAHESPRSSAQRDVMASGRATVNTPSIPLR